MLSAAEPSADVHAAHVVQALRAVSPSTDIEAVGGPHVAAAGATLVASSADLGVMGLVETVRSIPRHLALRRRLARVLAAGRYDLAVLVDYPGFHLQLAAAAANAGVPVLYYIAPQLWAWGSWRAARIRKYVRQLAVVLPFEHAFFNDRGMPATFVGHPLLDRDPVGPREAARQTLGVGTDTPVLALFPGSRRQEIRRLWPAFRDAARRLQQQVRGLEVVVAGTTTGRYPQSEGLVVWRGPSGHVFAAADAGLCKSGTTTLEAALYGMPMVIAYRMHPLSYAVARRAVRLPHIGLVNLVLQRPVAPELIQRAANAQALARAALPLLDPREEAARAQRRAFTEVRSHLGTPGAARRVAQLALTMVA